MYTAITAIGTRENAAAKGMFPATPWWVYTACPIKNFDVPIM